MILRGILERSLGGFICIRGFAKLSDLAKISKANASYQRELIEQHCQDLETFLDNREYLFFPEIILGYTINNQLDNIQLSATSQILEPTGEKLKQLNISISLKTYKGTGDIRNEEHIRTATLKIDDNYANKLFNRIDGNHRLTAVEHLSTEKTNILAPFCLVLFNDNDINTKQQSVIFHNINSKGENLTSEENLKGIFDNISFSDEDLKAQLGWIYVKARHLTIIIDTEYIPHIEHILHSNKRSNFVNILQFLHNKNVIDSTISDRLLKEKLILVNRIYQDSPLLKLSNSLSLLSSFLYYAFKENTENTLLRSFNMWVISKNIDKIKEADAESIVEIFEKIFSSQIKIFMAMPYYSNTEVSDYNTALTKSISAIKNQTPMLNIMHHPIMSNHSPTHDLIADILYKIKNCEIFIADITDNNPNVLYEYGIAKGYNKLCILLRKKTAATPVKSDYANDLRFEFDGNYDLESKFKIEIIAVLKELGHTV